MLSKILRQDNLGNGVCRVVSLEEQKRREEIIMIPEKLGLKLTTELKKEYRILIFLFLSAQGAASILSYFIVYWPFILG